MDIVGSLAGLVLFHKCALGAKKSKDSWSTLGSWHGELGMVLSLSARACAPQPFGFGNEFEGLLVLTVLIRRGWLGSDLVVVPSLIGRTTIA